MRKYVADFETTTDPEDCRVWEWGITEIGVSESFEWGKDIDEFMDWCYYRKGNPLIYIHNLRFDFEFIIYWLFENGFTYSDKKETKTFNCLITKMGQVYSLEIIWSKRGKKTKKTVFHDSLKKLPFKVSQIAKAFKLPIMKGEIDYHKKRPVGYDPDEEELAYLENDVKIVSAALKILFDQELTKMTVASDAMHHFKESLGGAFENSFPVLPLNVDSQIRYAYRGGFTYVSPRFAERDIGEGMVFDVNSLYPSVMYDKPLPIGQPLWFEGKYKKDKGYPLFIQEVYCEFQLKPGHIPMIQVKTGRYQENVYLENHIDNLGNDDPVTLYLTNMDMELFFEHYDVTVHSWNGGFMFRECTGIFKEYIDYWTAIKVENAEDKNALYTLAKLMLNSLYGKFASNPDVTGKYPIQKEDGSIGYKLKEEEYKDPVYTAMGVFITSWARHLTITTAQSLYPRFIYADTDSIHLEGTEFPENIEVHSSRLGAWKHEGNFTRARFIRQKTYIEEINGHLHVTCAGMPDTVKSGVTWENFKRGFTAGGKLLPKHVKGGLVLSDTDFTLK